MSKQAIKTRCKFRVIGVEATEHVITERVYGNDPAYSDMFGETWIDARYEVDHPQRRYKTKIVGRAENVRLAASYDTANPEDVSFAEATPSGELKIYVSNPAVIGTFEPGKNYYLDLIPCD